MSSTKPELKFSDSSEERSFYKRFISLPVKPSKTIRVVDKGEYYTVVGNDAIFVAENIYYTISVLKDSRVDSSTAKLINEPLKYVTLSQQVMSTLLKICLIDQGFKVEIYDKNWKLLKTASPGNIEQVDDLINMTLESSIVLASIKFQSNVQDGHCVLGISFIDSSNYRIGFLDVIDNEVFSNFESFLIQLGVKECLVPDLRDNTTSNVDLQKIISVLDRCSCVTTFVKTSEFTQKDIESDLIKLCGDELSMSIPKFSKLSLDSCNALLHYLHLLDDNNNEGKYELIQHSLDDFMKLDASSIKALNIFPSGPNISTGTSLNTNTGRTNSIFSLLNKCKTNAGVRLLNEWIKQPLTNLDKITERHNLVEYMIDNLELRSKLQNELLPSIPDIRRLIKKLNKNGNLEDILKIYQFILKVPEIIELLNDNLVELSDKDELKNLILKTWYNPLLESSKPLSKFQEMVETTVDLDVYEDANEFAIKVDFNEELSHIRKSLDNLKDSIELIHQETAEDLGFDPDKKLKLEVHHAHGWCMRLTRNDAKSLRQNKKYLELSTVKAGIYFTTKELRKLSEETTILKQEYDRQQSSLVKEIVAITLSYAPVLENLSMVIANLDVLCSFAYVSSYASIPYVRPKLHGLYTKRKTELIASRHPIVEVQDDITFISNDIKLESDIGEFLIITGPNMGGKSTYIRQVGVILLMAQIGCFVPCDSAEISIVDAILCRVGAGDSQLKGVSTFMVEMLETASILKNATENSLIIIDELGRGTSTYDGFGLAWSISKYIATQIKCFTLFATHFHELTSLADNLPNVINMNVIAHVEENSHNSDDITLLYKVEPGISDQSFGIHVAEVVQFPDKIVKMAKRKANELEELKHNVGELKKAKCSPEEVTKGIAELRNILQKWVSDIRSEGLDRNLSDPSIQKECIDSLKKMVKESYLSSEYHEFRESILKKLL